MPSVEVTARSAQGWSWVRPSPLTPTDEVTPTVVLFAADAGSYYVGATMSMNGGDDTI